MREGQRLSTTTQSHALYSRTTPSERFLLFTTPLILPLEAHIRQVPNFSIMFLIFSVLAVYVAINRLRCLDRVWMHPVFVAAYLFTGIIVALEFASPLSSYEKITSFALMIVGALLVRERRGTVSPSHRIPQQLRSCQSGLDR